MKKVYVIDTNVLIHDPKNALNAFDDNYVVLPIIIWEELDKLKRDPLVGFDVREVIRQLEEFRQKGDIISGVPTLSGGMLRIDAEKVNLNDLPSGFERKPDNIILLVTQRLQKNYKRDGRPVILVTKDIALRGKASAMKITAEDYESDKTIAVDKLYEGLVTVPATAQDISEIHREKQVRVEEKSLFARMTPNVCCILSDGIGTKATGAEAKTALAIYKKERGILKLVEKPGPRRKKTGISPRNDKQCLAYDLVMDQTISLVTLVGKAGTGKTLMALLAGLELLRKKVFKKIIVFRPNVEIGEPMGFLPGNIKEKFEPWAKPVTNCLELALDFSDKTVEEMILKGELEIQPFAYIRGMTYMDALVIVDEAQNLTPLIVKTAVTRIGERSKMVLTGDIKQIDNYHVDAQSNGLVHVMAKMPGQEIYGHLTLSKSERSVLAEIAAEVL